MKNNDNTTPEFYAHWTKEQLIEEAIRLNKQLMDVDEELDSALEMFKKVRSVLSDENTRQ